MMTLKNVLVATDFSPASETALTYGRAFARAFGGHLQILHVVQDLTAMAYLDGGVALAPPVEWQADLERVSKDRLEKLAAPQAADPAATPIMRTSNNPARAIVDCAREQAADLVVIGATGRGRMNRFLMGSVADKVIRQAPCPVLTVHYPEHEFVAGDTTSATGAKP